MLEKLTLESTMNLLEQYRKELNDLNNGEGLAKCMFEVEIESVKVMLKEHIATLEKSIYD